MSAATLLSALAVGLASTAGFAGLWWRERRRRLHADACITALKAAALEAGERSKMAEGMLAQAMDINAKRGRAAGDLDPS